MPKENHVFSTGDFIYLARKSYENAWTYDKYSNFFVEKVIYTLN